jgi:DNA-binding MarR family transcriptional regulator
MIPNERLNMAAPLSKWQQYGFSRTPYSTTAIRVADGGDRLLVGRSAELATIESDLVSGAQVIALEGDYGVGKSSLAAVAAHHAGQWGPSPEVWFLPPAGDSPLELVAGESTDAFEKRVYFRVAAALLPIADRLVTEGFKLPKLNEFRNWLHSPSGGGWSAGIGGSFGGFGATVSTGRQKTPPAFTDAGVIALLDSWMEELFASRTVGGVICILDNLEVLGSFDNAVVLFEALRDRMFKRKGLTWIVCGAEGMVRTAFSSPKMSGVFQEPIDVLPLGGTDIPKVIKARAEVVQVAVEAVLPVSSEAFEAVYVATGENLRFALGLAEKYALRANPDDLRRLSATERDDAFFAYVRGEGDRAVEQLSTKITDADWRVLETLVREKAGSCSPGDFADFGYADMPPLLTRVKSLERAGLVRYVKDRKRRRVITAENTARLAVSSRAA